jgi:hypothetical protein
MKSNISIPELDFEYKLWKNQLRYFESELQIYLARLMSVKLEVGAVANQYIPSLKEMIVRVHSLDKEIQLHEEEMAYYKKDYPIDYNHDHYLDFAAIKQRIKELSSDHEVLIGDINKNVSDYLYV